MQNEIIIKALSEKIERLEAENQNLNAALNAEIVDWGAGIAAKVTPDYQADAIAKRISEVTAENLQLENENECRIDMIGRQNEIISELRRNNLALKDKNERLEKWDKEHSEKIADLEHENGILMKHYQRDELFFEKLSKIPQWKNSVKDRLPKTEIGTVIVFQFSGDTGYDKWDFLESDDIDGFNTYISQRQIDHYMIIKIKDELN